MLIISARRSRGSGRTRTRPVVESLFARASPERLGSAGAEVWTSNDIC